MDHHRGGWIEIIAGGMFSGKSEELIRRLRRAVIARQRVQVFKPILDDRFATDEVVSRDDRRLKAHAVATSAEMLARVGSPCRSWRGQSVLRPGASSRSAAARRCRHPRHSRRIDQATARPFGRCRLYWRWLRSVEMPRLRKCRGAAILAASGRRATRRLRWGTPRKTARCRHWFEAYHAVPEETPAVQLTIPQPVAGNA